MMMMMMRCNNISMGSARLYLVRNCPDNLGVV